MAWDDFTAVVAIKMNLQTSLLVVSYADLENLERSIRWQEKSLRALSQRFWWGQ